MKLRVTDFFVAAIAIVTSTTAYVAAANSDRTRIAGMVSDAEFDAMIYPGRASDQHPCKQMDRDYAIRFEQWFEARGEFLTRDQALRFVDNGWPAAHGGSVGRGENVFDFREYFSDGRSVMGGADFTALRQRVLKKIFERAANDINWPYDHPFSIRNLNRVMSPLIGGLTEGTGIELDWETQLEIAYWMRVEAGRPLDPNEILPFARLVQFNSHAGRNASGPYTDSVRSTAAWKIVKHHFRTSPQVHLNVVQVVNGTYVNAFGMPPSRPMIFTVHTLEDQMRNGEFNRYEEAARLKGPDAEILQSAPQLGNELLVTYAQRNDVSFHFDEIQRVLSFLRPVRRGTYNGPYDLPSARFKIIETFFLANDFDVSFSDAMELIGEVEQAGNRRHVLAEAYLERTKQMENQAQAKRLHGEVLKSLLNVESPTQRSCREILEAKRDQL